ncbi:hypothetical protein CHO01_28800 [Cellulomonas hominis]|uniref:Uncharacterized protein n=1 Tax=Cellulomonas hominis TaxID=156981 RepID=A0A511FGQ7_9CELL|nr:hypothetical protein [Cellulomonas hominis]MBB5474769.1 hypothetical protein [Cellulomonas hominis]NKY05425.1 hypothetical protein [Cellulomonas hominis]GEL47764.1 hypothetical protein CHO01_28800 [Cellulomonas hominis]
MSTGVEQDCVRVESGGHTASWSRHEGFAGDAALVAPALFAAHVGLEVPIGDTTVVAGDGSPEQAAAALVCFDPAHIRIVAGPSRLLH